MIGTDIVAGSEADSLPVVAGTAFGISTSSPHDHNFLKNFFGILVKIFVGHNLHPQLQTARQRKHDFRLHSVVVSRNYHLKKRRFIMNRLIFVNKKINGSA